MILCATDFSPASARAVQLAGALAKRTGEGVTLLHVLAPATFVYPIPPAVSPPAPIDSPAVEAVARARFDEAAALLRARGVHVETRLAVGLPTDEILAAIGETGPTLVVVGSHGRAAAARFFLGSVAERLLKRSSVPVLVARPRHGEPVDVPADHVERPLRIVIGVDGSAASAAALDWLRLLRRTVACDVVAVTTFWPPAEAARLHLPAGTPETASAPLVAALTQELRERVGDLPGAGTLDLRVEAAWGEDPDPLARMAGAEEPDLLVVGSAQSRKHGATGGSTALATVRAASVPVLCVPAATTKRGRARRPPAARPRGEPAPR